MVARSPPRVDPGSTAAQAPPVTLLTVENDQDLVRPDYTGAAVSSLVPALLGTEPAPWLPGCVAGARSVVLLVLDGFGWRAIDAARPELPVMGSLEGGPITTVVPSTT